MRDCHEGVKEKRKTGQTEERGERVRAVERVFLSGGYGSGRGGPTDRAVLFIPRGHWDRPGRRIREGE